MGGDVCVQNTRLPTAATETPFRLKLYIFLFKFCNIASSLILLSFHLLVLFLPLVLNIYLYFLGFFFSFLTLQNERQNDGRLTIYNNFLLPNINRFSIDPRVIYNHLL